MRRALAGGLVLLLAACATGSSAPAPIAPVEQPATPATDLPKEEPSAPTTTRAVTTSQAGPVEATWLGKGGTGGTGQQVSSDRLQAGTTYRIGDFALPFRVTAPIDHWAHGSRSSGHVLFEWRGEGGQRGGSLYVLVFHPTSGTVDEAWLAIESLVTSGFEKSGSDWEWLDTGSGLVAGMEVGWREVRSTPDIVMLNGYPCIIGLPSACVWIDATARFYVVPLDGFTVSIAAWENRCDCEVGPSYRSFVGQPNELHDWLGELQGFLDGLAFET